MIFEMRKLNRSGVNSVKYGTETITSLGAKIRNILPNDYKELKSKIQRLCKIYIQRVGFIWLGIVTSDQCLLNVIFFFFFVVVAVAVCLLLFLLLLLLLLLS